MITRSRTHTYKFVLSGLLIGWFIKYPAFFHEYINSAVYDYRISFNFFPEFFKSYYTLAFCYYLPVLTIPVLFYNRVVMHKTFLQIAAGFFCLSSLLLLCHQATYNDATFNVSFWVSCWLLWYSTNIDSEAEDFEKHLIILAKLITSLIFVGGVVGKLTDEWWNGEVLFGIYESFFHHYPFNYLKEEYSFENQKSIMTILSKVIIIMELIIAIGIFMKERLYFNTIPFLIAGIILFRGWQIISVIGSLVFLLTACRPYVKEKLLQSR